MSYFKVGDKVRCISSQTANGEQIDVGYVGTITHIASDGAIAVDNMFGHMGYAVCCPEAFEKIKEEPKQMKATDKITVEITLAELAVSYMVFSKMKAGTSDNLYHTAKQMLDLGGTIREATFRNVPASGIIDKCNNPEDVFELMFPEPPKKSKEQIKIEELQETIDKAAQQIKELKEGK